jgi:hypothetical protein
MSMRVILNTIDAIFDSFENIKQNGNNLLIREGVG